MAHEQKAIQIPHYLVPSSLPNHKDFTQNAIKDLTMPEALYIRERQQISTSSVLREVLSKRCLLPISKLSEVSSPQELAKITSFEGSEADIPENRLRSKEFILVSLSDKILAFFKRSGKRWLSEAFNTVSSSKGVSGLKVLEAHSDGREFSAFDIDNSKNFRSESTLLDKEILIPHIF
jgi:uncharacterized protein (DUF4415 family)